MSAQELRAVLSFAFSVLFFAFFYFALRCIALDSGYGVGLDYWKV